jgi:hypothetical protein
MASAPALTVDVTSASAMRSMTLDVRLTGKRRMDARVWLGCRLIRLAAWVCGCGYGVSVDLRKDNERHGMTGYAGVPIRLAVNDADFDHHLGSRLRIMLDGVEMRDVTAYDIDAGTITRHAHDARGRLVVKGQQLVVEVLRGDVAVGWIDDVMVDRNGIYHRPPR